MSSEYSKHKNINIGVAGAGYWGKNLVRIFSQLGVLKTVCDSEESILKRIKAEYPHISATDDFSDILTDEKIGAVVIATPAATHYRLAKEAIEKGKDVFVEKPLALSVEEGEQLVALAKERNRVLMVGHLLMYHPAVVELKKIIKEGRMGKIRYVYSNRLNFGKLRREENVLWSFAPHDISVIIDILGMPKTAMAVGKSYVQKGIPDITVSCLEFEEMKAAHVFVSWLNPFKEQKLSIIGSKTMAVFDDTAADKLVIYPHKLKKRGNNNFEAAKAEKIIIKLSGKEPLMEEAKHFLNCVEKRKKPITDGKKALDVLKVLDACQKSLNQNGKKIQI